MLDFVFRNTTQDKEFGETFFKKVLQSALKVLKLSEKHVELSLTLVGPQRIRTLNKTYRRKDKVTDVLSFPLGEAYGTRYTIFALGDIFICPSYARSRADEQKIQIADHIAWMTIHALLHLLDYDHERSAKDAEIMTTLEEKILKTIPRT